ncbi:MAG: protein phosphatase CheZ [Bacteroidetes bacterium]|nr:protein phosphatase CheZ [Bacteroidota bacterium]
MEPQQNNEAIMKDVLQLLKEIVPLLESVRHSIQESTKHIPNATEQLSKVSEATESATVEILDLIDVLSEQLTKLQERVRTFQQSLQSSRALVLENLGTLRKALTDSSQLHCIESIEHYFTNQSLDAFFDELHSIFESTKMQYTSIAMALQVQDITNQQIVGVSQIIDIVYRHLASALHRFEHGVHESLPPLDEHTDVVVDINAQYTKSPKRQMTADEIVQQWQEMQKRKQ